MRTDREWQLFVALAGGVDAIHERDERKEHRDNDAAYNHGQKDDHDRFQQRRHGRHGVIHFFVVVVGDLQQHFRQGAGLFADVHHADNHRRENAGSFQRRGDGFAFLHAFMDCAHRVTDDDVAGSFLHDGQRLQERHAAADESAERAREARDRNLADHRPEHRHFQFEFVPDATAGLGADDPKKYSNEHGDHCQRVYDVVLDGAGNAEHQARERGKLRAFHHALEHRLELRDDINHQHPHDRHGHDHDCAGIKHRRDNLALDLLRLFHELGQTVQHDFKHTAQFAGFHHVHEQTVKDLGMLRQGFGESTAALDG